MGIWIGAAVITAALAAGLDVQAPAPAAGDSRAAERGADRRAEPPVPADSPAALTAALDALDQKVRILERRLELERAAAAATVQTTATVGAGADGFSIRSTDGAFVLRLRGLIHSDGRFYPGGGDGPADSFIIRRARPILDATLFSFIDARLMPDFGNGSTVLQDAYLVARLAPPFRIRAGKFKAPVGLERLQPASDTLFVERALPTGLVPNRDLGVMVEGDVLGERVLYQAGVFNGVVDGGSADADDRPGKDYAGRVFATPFKGRGRDRVAALGVGLGASVGRIDGVPSAPGLPSYRTAGQQVFFRYRTGLTPEATTLAAGHRIRLSPQAAYYSGRLGMLAEYVVSSQEVARGTSQAVLDTTSWQIAGSWVLTGEANTGRAIRPAHPFEPGTGALGAFELTARINALAADHDAFPLFADPASGAARAGGWAAGLNWYLDRALKFSVDYEETRFRGGAAAGTDRPTERDLFTRFQLSF